MTVTRADINEAFNRAWVAAQGNEAIDSARAYACLIGAYEGAILALSDAMCDADKAYLLERINVVTRAVAEKE